MEIIYLVEDINDLQYVGRTKRDLIIRHKEHKWSKYNKSKKCSSNKLNIENSTITELEICETDIAKEREQYWINKIDSVNTNNTYFDKKEYYKMNKDKILTNQKKNKSQKWFCETCNCELNKGEKSRHSKTKKHLSQIQQSQDTQEFPDES
tara:strand:+ start:51 stop:503 length:453 start_codon:yes stop_codon:yes gene_type:complete